MFDLSEKENNALKELRKCGYNIEAITLDNPDEYRKLEITLTKKDYKTIGGKIIN